MNTPVEASLDGGSGGAPRFDRQGDPYEIRVYRPEDIGALEGFYEEFEPKRAAQGLPPEGSERIRKWLSSILAAGVHLVVTRQDALVGHALVAPMQRAGVGEYAVFLHQDLRGRGIGTEMNRAVVDAARDAGYTSLWLSVTPRNRAAIRSYERVGFRFVQATVLSTEAEMELSLV